MKLKDYLKQPKVRFKTIAELISEYGTNWWDAMYPLPSDAAIASMTIYQGKVLFDCLVQRAYNSVFMYGNSSKASETYIHKNCVTTKALPRYDSRGNVLKPGMIVRIEYVALEPNEIALVPSDLRNEPGTLVKVLKVVKPSEYLTKAPKSGVLNHFAIATELRCPFSGALIDYVHKTYKDLFIKGDVCAFEISHRVAKATEEEKEFYYRMIWG